MMILGELAWAALSTAEVSDALDRLGLSGQLLGIRCLVAGTRLWGRAFTVEYGLIGDPPETVGDYLDDVQAGAVIVLANQGRADCTAWGGIMSRVASRGQIAGTVVDGVARDTQTAAEVKYPLFARGRYMRTGKDRVQVTAVGQPVTVAGVLVRPGDIVLGDADGVVVVDARRQHEVLRVAEHIRDTEAGIMRATEAGTSLRDARQAVGYHDLQRSRS